MARRSIIETERIKEVLANAWLRIPYLEKDLYNPIQTVPDMYFEEPHMFILSLLSSPDYFALFAKEILNITLAPFQCTILEELWTRKFPMLIGSRGLGKCVNGNTLIVTENGIERIGNLVGWQAEEKEPIYNLPSVLNENGTFNKVEYGWNNGFGPAIKIETEYGFEIEGTPEHPIRVIRNGQLEWVELQYIRQEDIIPIDRNYIPYFSSKDIVRKFIQKEMDRNAKVDCNSLCVFYSSDLPEIVKSLQFALTRFGIISKAVGHILYITDENVLLYSEEIGFLDNDKAESLNYIINSQELSGVHSFQFHDKIKKIESTKCQTFDVHCIDDHSFISNGIISHNSYLLGLYALLRMVFMPGRKIIITGAGYRQSKIIFEYIEKFWYGAPLLRDMVGTSAPNGPHKNPDMWRFVIGESQAVALPVGTGEKIRGQRAHDILVDEFAVGNEQIFEHVISGFAAVSSNPIANIQSVATRELAEQMNIKLEDEIDDTHRANQIVLTGTAYYSFNHFYKYWRQWQNIIKSRGDKRKLLEFGINDTDVNWRDYSIIRIPYKLIPRGFMEDAIVARSRSTMHSSLYLMEYEACLSRDTKILTDCGVKNIQDLIIGDLVLTHNGRFRPVTKLMSRVHSGNIINIKTFGYNQTISITSEHPVLKNGDFIPVKNVDDDFELSNLKELNNKKYINTNLYTHNYKERSGFIYPMSGASKFSNDIVNYILDNIDNISRKDLANNLGITTTNVNSIISLSKRKLPKNSIPSNILLDYNFGLIVGYYASEGSIGANGRLVSFSLDGHVNTKLQSYVDELVLAIRASIGITPKLYSTNDNTINICVNSRIFADVMKEICPGICYTKTVRSDILYSNEEFLRGFITGYWNGDGCISDKRTEVSANSTSENLIYQTKLALSYFGIASAIYKKEGCINPFKGKQIQGSDFYEIKLDSDNARLFKNIFYNQNYYISNNKKQKIKNNGNVSIYKSKSVLYLPYNDYVYNIEVAEDHTYSLTNMTVHNCFGNDSNGFFKRLIIERCVGEHKVLTEGEENKSYVLAVDPASEHDNFCIVLLEVTSNTRKVVSCWTTKRTAYKAERKAGIAKQDDFYDYAARKIMQYVNNFNIIGIAIDTQGGGRTIIERLHSSNVIDTENGEQLLWSFIDPENPKEEDGEYGLHIIEEVQFANPEWNSGANHGMRLDLETRALLFPKFDSLTFAQFDLSIENGIERASELDEITKEIEGMKDELSSIVMTQTPTGREHWDTPEQRTSGIKKGGMRKDRYSALLMANALAKKLGINRPSISYEYEGGFARFSQNKDLDKPNAPMYSGNTILSKKLNDLYKDM